jgi:glutamine synthetase
MSKYTREDVIRMCKEQDVEFIRLQFTDILGTLKNIAVTISQLDRALDNQFRFDGSCIEGFDGAQESELYLYPDYDTLEVFPWRPQQGRVARLLCDVYTAEGKPYEGDSRYILQKAIKEAEDMGYTLCVEPECEFFLFHTDETGNPTTVTHEQAGYFDIGPLDLGENARRDMVLTLEEMGFVIKSSHHEAAPAQHEIDFQYDNALKTADNIMTFKLAIKTIAKRHGLHATFMPKPKAGCDGSGMHLKFALQKDGKNIFFDESDTIGLGKEGYYFIGGLMRHIKGMTAIFNPLVNSYKRLVPGYEAPAYITWSNQNGRHLVCAQTAAGEKTSIELRSPDPAANPYLAIAVALMAGLDGIRHRIEPPKSMSGNIKAMTEKEKKAVGADTLPDNLFAAMEEFQKDTFMKEVLGETIYQNYVDNKLKEWNEYKAQVTDWEVEKYLYRY